MTRPLEHMPVHREPRGAEVFKKSPQEKLEAKKAKSEWKKSQRAQKSNLGS